MPNTASIRQATSYVEVVQLLHRTRSVIILSWAEAQRLAKHRHSMDSMDSMDSMESMGSMESMDSMHSMEFHGLHAAAGGTIPPPPQQA